ncbi:MAG: hypothetical protein WAU00_10865 [Caldilinea sp.]|uniref:hypothetical protein n=1 Tax=Caldilinea sp. TaxID=2293560 RepID=UPI002CC7AEAB|nr:hypothetical protein [Caldilinea sp.]HRA68113.1 hypothetical protein [Caldilinea sp.]
MKRTKEVNGNANDNAAARGPQPIVDVMLEVERPSVEELACYPRDERYRRLRANTEAHRNQLEGWIELQHLTSEVMAMSPATGFNLLFVKCTPHAAQELARAPGVVDVLPAGDVINGLQQLY